jgi:hypothetical protein
MQPSLNPWSYKPWWCQPWSIALTGWGAITATALLTRNLWLTLVVALPLGAWMGFFLLLWPRLMGESLRTNLVDQPTDCDTCSSTQEQQAIESD